MIRAKVNGVSVEVPQGSTILNACEKAGVYIPTLCNHPDIPPAGKCGLCIVKVNDSSYVLSCSTKVQDNMVIETNSADVKARAEQALEKFDDMNMMPMSEEIENVYKYFRNKNPKRGRSAEKTNSVQFDPSQCINCGRCVRQCAEGQAIGALDEDSHLLAENECIGCGQCTTVCPTSALTERLSGSRVVKALAQGKVLCLQTAPSVRVAAGECFGYPVGTVVTGKIVAAARQMGFKYVFDTNFGADLTILEEGSELIERLTHGGVLPMFTSCCPAWVNFVERIHPELIPNLSTAKSPHTMTGRMIKTYFAEKKSIDPSKIYVVSLMPCTAKKDEIEREQLKGDVDAVLTTREFGKLVKEFEIDWQNIENSQFDALLGESTGAAALFGVTGGVMEAALRYTHEVLTKEKLGKVEYTQWRGFKGIKTSSAIINGINLNIAVCSGIASAREFIESGSYKNFHFIEVMACPMGCIAGGGQPKLKSRADAKRRADAIYEIDHQSIGKVTSNDNNEIKQLYDTYLGCPNGEKAHKLLHTHFRQQVTTLLEMKKQQDNAPIVAYGSSSGTAMRLAKTVAGYIGASPVSLNNCGLAKMKQRGTAIIFCSTFGDGEMPNNAAKFFESLVNTEEDLSGLKFSVCALGSKMYPKFCVAGHDIEKHLIAKGAQKLMPIVEIDSSLTDKGEGTFEQWVPMVLNKLGYKMPEIKIEPAFRYKVHKNKDDVIHAKPESPLGYHWGVLVSSTLLTPAGFQPAMHQYEVKLPVGMSYKAGDHAAIMPENDPGVVTEVIKELHLDEEDILEIETSLPEGLSCIPPKVTVRQLFAQYLDLNCIPSRNLIRAFKQYCKDEFALDRLTRLLDVAEPRYYNDLANDSNTAEFILEYSRHGAPPLDVLMTACSHIQPRLYSIASAPSNTSRSIDLVITDNIFGPGNTRRGLCTSYLSRFGLTKIALNTQTGCFGYPDTSETPIMMAALGCGIAPMLSLLQHREYLTGKVGPASLFFGCRYKNTYPILDSILDNYVELKALQNLYVAYSREGTTKTYITDLMANNPDVVWEYWKNPKTQFFYCGPARGIPDQLRDIIISITMKKGNMTKEEAEAFYDLHKINIEAF